jgi:peptidoglycan/xylan/chitin deacetylase (PgdA/CDA1 family)
MLYRVSPEPVRAFEPNRILKITPDFLDNVVRQVIEAGFDLLSMDEVLERLAARRSARPFACFTLVDGYRDNLEYALPVFKRYGAPFTVYVPTDYMDGTGGLWWLTLKRAIEASDCIRS